MAEATSSLLPSRVRRGSFVVVVVVFRSLRFGVFVSVFVSAQCP